MKVTFSIATASQVIIIVLNIFPNNFATDSLAGFSFILYTILVQPSCYTFVPMYVYE